MGETINYGKWVSLSATVLITGLLWHERASVEVRGEDVAECVAGALEREVAFLTGTQAPFHTNVTVSSHIEWSQIWDNALVRIRNAAYRYGYGVSSIWWLYPGSAFGTSQAPVIGSRVYEYYSVPADGAHIWGAAPSNSVAVNCFSTFDTIDNALPSALHPPSGYGRGGTNASGLVSYYPSIALPFGITGVGEVEQAVQTVPAPVDFGTNSPLFGDVPCPWMAEGICSNMAGFYPSAEYYRVTVGTDGVVSTNLVYNKFVTTNKLDDVKKVAALLTSTVAVVSPSVGANTYTVAKAMWYEASGDAVYPETGYQWDAYVASWNLRSVEITNPNSWEPTDTALDFYHTTYGFWYKVLARVSADFRYRDQNVTENSWVQYFSWADPPYSEGDDYPSGSLFLYGYHNQLPWTVCYKMYNVTVTYPSQYAITNGYVSRVRVYAVIGSSVAQALSEEWAPVDGWDGTVTTPNPQNHPGSGSYPVYTETYSRTVGSIAKDHTQPNQFINKVFGSGYTVSTRTIPDGFATGDNPRWLPYTLANATLIKDVQNPTDYPVTFDFGISDISSSDLMPCWQQESWESTYSYTLENLLGPPGGARDEDSYRWCKATRITTKGRSMYTNHSLLWDGTFIVVVDWNWKHLNDANPYVPKPYTPEWMKPKTP